MTPWQLRTGAMPLLACCSPPHSATVLIQHQQSLTSRLRAPAPVPTVGKGCRRRGAGAHHLPHASPPLSSKNWRRPPRGVPAALPRLMLEDACAISKHPVARGAPRDPDELLLTSPPGTRVEAEQFRQVAEERKLTFIPQGCHLPPANGELEISFLHCRAARWSCHQRRSICANVDLLWL